MINRELKQNTTAMATGTSSNKVFKEQNSGYARAFWFLVHFFSVLCKTTMWNDKIGHSEFPCASVSNRYEYDLICMKMKLHAGLIFIWKILTLDSFWNRGTRELRNGLLYVGWRTWTTTANFSYFYLELNSFIAYSAGAGFNTDRHIGYSCSSKSNQIPQIVLVKGP